MSIVTYRQPHFQRRKARALRVGLPFLSFIGPGLPPILAQKDFLRGPPSGWGALRLLPVAALYLALPFAVRPPLGLFSPRPKERDTPFFFAGAILLHLGRVLLAFEGKTAFASLAGSSKGGEAIGGPQSRSKGGAGSRSPRAGSYQCV